MSTRRLFIIVLFFLTATLGLLGYIQYQEKTTEVSITEPVQATGENLPVHITFLDIGQGDATFLEWSDGTQMLVDCAKNAVILEALGRVMSYYDHTIDYLIVTHPDLDHYGGCIDVLKRFDIKHVVFNGYKKENSSMLKTFLETKDAEGAIYTEIKEPEIWTIGSTTIHFLYPDHSVALDGKIPGAAKDTGSNNASIVFKLSYGDTDLLMTGDAEIPLEKYLLDKYGTALDVEVLKAGHHGSSGSTSQPWLDVITPDMTIFSAGKANPYGHPSLRIIRRVERAGSKVYRTDRQGDVRIRLYKDKVLLDNGGRN